jgi:deoxycytidylate deaminase
MFSAEEKRFFIGVALGTRDLSKCEIKQGAIIVDRNKSILSYGYNVRIMDNADYYISAVENTILSLSKKSVDLVLFSSYFPKLNDMRLVVSCGIQVVYFMGNIDDPDCAKFANALTEHSIPLELRKLQH